MERTTAITKKSQRNDLLSEIKQLDSELQELDDSYKKNRLYKKSEFIHAILEAQRQDIPMAEITKAVGKSRSAIYKMIKDIIGVRYPEMKRQ